MLDNSRPNPTAVLWTAAGLASLLGTAILFDAEPGINWPIWVASAAAAVLISRKAARQRIGNPVLILLAWAVVLASAAAVTANEGIRVLVVMSVAMLLGLAVIVTGAESWRTLSAKLLPTVPFLAPARVAVATIREVSAAPRAISSPRVRPVVRGLLFTIPLVIVLLALLQNADPIIAWSWQHVIAWLPQWSVSERLLFFLFLLFITLGASAVAARQPGQRVPALPKVSIPSTLGVIEQRMILIGMAIVLWLFVILQVTYLIHSPPQAVGSGVTFAEYARRGFAELSVAVTLVGGVILLLEATRAPGPGAAALVRLEIALLVALELILLSAFRRVVLYEQAYGFTTARLFAQAYMVVVALALVALALELGKGAVSVNFGRRVSIIALGVFTMVAFWNYEAWIANRNIDRSAVTGKFDSYYARHLSPDAWPVLLKRRDQLPAGERAQIETWLGCRRLPAERRWFEANLRMAAARRAMLDEGIYSRGQSCVQAKPTEGASSGTQAN